MQSLRRFVLALDVVAAAIWSHIAYSFLAAGELFPMLVAALAAAWFITHAARLPK